MGWEQIGLKQVYMVDKHHHVLPAWSKVRQEVNGPLCLISFDHHTDLHPAFRTYAAHQLGPLATADQHAAACASRLAASSGSTPQTAQAAMADLNHDEHIDFAVKTSIIDHAYVFLSWRRFNLRHADATVFQPRAVQVTSDMDKAEADLDTLAEEVIEASRLGPLIARIENMVGPLDSAQYILDIDLDAFSRNASILPRDPAMFRRLIRHAYALTVAREPTYIEGQNSSSCMRENGMKVAFLEATLRAHIKAA